VQHLEQQRWCRWSECYITAVTSNTTLNLTSVSNGARSRPLTATATVTVNAYTSGSNASSNGLFVLVADAIFYYAGTAGNAARIIPDIWNAFLLVQVER
jgi:hypothetical protein